MSQSYQMRKFGQTYDAMSDEALQIVEHEARKILKAHSNLDEFVMCMGDWFFTRKKYGNIHSHIVVDVKYVTKSNLATFLGEWDREIKITSTPMRFTAHGKKRTEW